MEDRTESALFVAEERTKTYIGQLADIDSRKFITSATGIDTARVPGLEIKAEGKVRDVFARDDVMVIVTTDRQSAFDRRLAAVPFKGQVLNLLSAWWFRQSSALVPNAFIACPHPNVTIARKCTVFPVEFVVRGYITGSTATSIWVNYSNGIRDYCGNQLPEGLCKNQQLERPLLTPTTKSTEHDMLISAEDIVSEGLMTQSHWNLCAQYALALFEFGQQECLKKGLILVDTKYEFGLDVADNTVRLLDEIHTPDSSRFWRADTYYERMEDGQEPDNIDKEFLRRWYISQCDPYDQSLSLPQPPQELIRELARRYIVVYETITGQRFNFAAAAGGEVAVYAAIYSYFAQQK